MKTTTIAVVLGALATLLATTAHADDDARCARRTEKLQAQESDGSAPDRYGDTGCANVEAFLTLHGYRRETRIRAGWIGAGAGIFAGTYLLSAIPAAANNGNANNPWAPLLIPVAGPFIMAANAFSWASHDAFGGFDDLVGVFLVVDGLAQISGIALAIAGATTTKTVFVREPQARLHFTPMLGKQSAGLSLSLTL